MVKLHVPDLFIYRWRYAFGYITVGLGCLVLLFVASLYIPGGLSDREIAAVTTANDLSIKHFQPDMVVNLPYYLTQKAGFYLFGLSEFSVKLPTIILGALLVLGLVLLLKMWFKRNVAVLTAIVGIAAGPFLLAAQSGSPGILYIFWPVWLLYTAAVIARRPTFPIAWKALFFILVALSLYTPLSIYVVIALVSAALLHPHLRHVVRSLSKFRIITTLLIASVFVIPLGYSLYQEPSFILKLLGIPTSLDILANLHQLFTQYVDVVDPSNSTIMTPVYEVASLMLAGVGIYRIVTAKYTARSYILSCWLVFLIPILIVNPGLINVTFLPFLLLTGYGIEFLIRYWYRLFPRNPYARVVGLIPIVILITTLTLSGLDRFIYGYLYNPSAARQASGDLTILATELRHTPKQPVTLVVTSHEQAFYRAVRRYNPEWNIHEVTSTYPTDTSATVIASRGVRASIQIDTMPDKILASPLSEQADRFYIYKNPS